MQLGWVDFSREDREKVLDVLNLLQEQGAVAWYSQRRLEKILHTPQPVIGDGDVHGALTADTGNSLLSIQNLHLDRAGDGGTHPYFHHGRVNGDGADSDTVQFNMCFGRSPQLHRAINTRPGIPPGIGLIGVPGDDLDGVFTGVEVCVQIHIEIGVAIRTKSCPLPVDELKALITPPIPPIM